MVRKLTPTLFALAAGCCAAHGEDPSEAFSWLMPTITPFTLGGSAGVDRETPEPLTGQPGTFARTTVRATLKVQPWYGDHDEVQANVSYGRADLQSDAVFPKTGPLPDLLFDERVGATYRHVSDDHSLWGASASVGSSSDHPFSDSSSLVVAASIFDRIPVREHDAVILSLAYSNDRAVFNNIPFPVVLYQWTASPTTTVIAGLPLLAVIWRPSPRLNGEMFLSGFGSAHAGLSGAPIADFVAFRLRAAIDYGGDVYRRAHAENRTDRIIFRELRFTAGLGLERGHSASASVYGGYATDREIIEGSSLLEHDNRISIESGPVFGANASFRF
jgi:hypothetical protein